MTRDFFTRATAWVRDNVELGALLVLTLAIAGFWAFAELADEVLEGATRNLDRDLLLLLRTPGDPDDPVGPDWVEEIMRDFTAMGGIALLTITTLAVAGFFLLQRKFASTLYLLVAVGGGLLLSAVSKNLFDSTRGVEPARCRLYSSSHAPYPPKHPRSRDARRLRCPCRRRRLSRCWRRCRPQPQSRRPIRPPHLWRFPRRHRAGGADRRTGAARRSRGGGGRRGGGGEVSTVRRIAGRPRRRPSGSPKASPEAGRRCGRRPPGSTGSACGRSGCFFRAIEDLLLVIAATVAAFLVLRAGARIVYRRMGARYRRPGSRRGGSSSLPQA
jgi:hypothetical protein